MADRKSENSDKKSRGISASSALQSFSNWVDEHKRALSNAFYTAGLAGIVAVLHSVRGVRIKKSPLSPC